MRRNRNLIPNFGRNFSLSRSRTRHPTPRAGSPNPARRVWRPLGRTLLGLAALAVLAAGCNTYAPEVRRPAFEPDADACAERLHEACGRLLLYYSLNRRLPPTREALAAADPQSPLPLVCPLSGEPYTYLPQGLLVKGRAGRLVLYDSSPAHGGMRWGVFVAAAGARMDARVLLVPDNLITSAIGAPVKP